MRDKLNLSKKGVIKIATLSLVTVATLLITGYVQKEVTSMIPKENKATQKQTSTIEKSFIIKQSLHDAVKAKNIDQVKFLVSNKSDINRKDYYGYSPLHLAVRLKQYDIAKYLITNGADVNNLDSYKDTPLLDSTRDNSTNLSKLLICNGAKRRVVDRYDMTPMHYSIQGKNQLIFDMLRAKDLTPYCNENKNSDNGDISTNNRPKELEIPLAKTQEFKGLYGALMEEFKDDFKIWNAELTKDDLLFRFNNPLTLFERGSNKIKPRFANILKDFFPRYLKVLSQYQESIQEVRVEGYTSSEWRSANSDTDRYRFNKILSEKRASAIRNFSVNTVLLNKGNSQLKPEIAQNIKNSNVDGTWVEDKFQPYGMAYDNPILNPDGTENKKASRRVVFKIVKK